VLGGFVLTKFLVTLIQTFEVEAETEAEARDRAFDRHVRNGADTFDVTCEEVKSAEPGASQA